MGEEVLDIVHDIEAAVVGIGLAGDKKLISFNLFQVIDNLFAIEQFLR